MTVAASERPVFQSNDSLADGPPPPLSANNDQRGGGFEYNGKVSFDTAEAALHLARAGLSWSALGQAATISFAFRASATTMPSDVQGFVSFTTAQIQATLLALQSWSDVAGLVFVRQDDGSGYSNNATMLFGGYSTGADGAAAFAFLPGPISAASTAGDVWVNSSLGYNAVPTVWGYGQLTLVHEIGHALGLLHPADYDASADDPITYAADAIYAEDSNQYTVMSYFRETTTGASYGVGRYAAAPLLDDIAAAQRLYGANMSTRTGDTTYGFNSTADRAWFSASVGQRAPVFAIWDAGGVDTLDASGYGGRQLLDLRQGAFSDFSGSTGNVAIAIGAVVENVIGGAGDDTINGNSANNRITPGAGSNQVEGGLGIDTLVFSGPRSAYTITMDGQRGFISGPEGTTRFQNVEFLAFSDGIIAAPQGTGGITVSGDMTNDLVEGAGFDDTLSGGGGNDVIRGFDGHDRLHGGKGDDVLEGGSGNDLFYIDQGNDTISGGDGTDTLDASAAFGGMQINLQSGTIAGGQMGVDSVSGIERIIGSRFNDVITGGAEDNYLQGFGGIDILRGGGGNDELVASWAEAGGGADVIKSAQQANNDVGAAISLDNAFDRLSREGVQSSGTPHATVVATTHGGLEYYAFTVGANTDVSFDIDGAAFDSTLRIFDAAGVELAANDDGSYSGDGGLATDSFLTYRFVSAGTYYVQVGRYAAGPSGSPFVTTAPAAGLSYTLHVSIPDHAVQPTYAQGSELYGDAGDDILRSSVGSDVLDGGSGFDTAVFTGVRSSYTVTVSDGVTRVTNADGTDTVSNVERLQFADMRTDAAGLPETNVINGTAGADTLNGTAGADTINGLGGDDLISGLDGNDILDGGAGDDVIRGGAGNDQLTGGDGFDTLEGGAGDDVYFTTAGDIIVELANEGIDIVYSQGSHELAANVEAVYLLGSGHLVGQGNGGANYIYGGGGDDSLFGFSGDDLLDGGAGNDFLSGGEGSDWLRGGAGNDTLNGGESADTMDGGSGDDIYFVDNVGDVVTEAAGAGIDVVRTALDRFILPSNVEGVELQGSANLTIYGRGTNDYLYGNSGNNILFGDAGNDLLDGGAGDDVFSGGAGNDLLRDLGGGNDQFIFTGAWGNDTIQGFQAGPGLQDTIFFEKTMFANVDAVVAAWSDVNGNVVINAGNGNTVTIFGVTTAQLAGNDFMFI